MLQQSVTAHRRDACFVSRRVKRNQGTCQDDPYDDKPHAFNMPSPHMGREALIAMGCGESYIHNPRPLLTKGSAAALL
jgi:hypothetical protein